MIINAINKQKSFEKHSGSFLKEGFFSHFKIKNKCNKQFKITQKYLIVSNKL